MARRPPAARPWSRPRSRAVVPAVSTTVPPARRRSSRAADRSAPTVAVPSTPSRSHIRLVRVVRLGAVGDAPAGVRLAGDEQRLQVRDRPAGGQVAEVAGQPEHPGQLGGDLAFHRGGRRAAVQGMVVGVDQHRGEVAGHRGRVRGLEHLPGVARVEERVIVRQPAGELREGRGEPFVADLSDAWCSNGPNPACHSSTASTPPLSQRLRSISAPLHAPPSGPARPAAPLAPARTPSWQPGSRPQAGGPALGRGHSRARCCPHAAA